MTSSARASSDEVTDRDLPAASDSNECPCDCAPTICLITPREDSTLAELRLEAQSEVQLGSDDEINMF